MDEQKDNAFTRWLLEKEERFYILFLVGTLLVFTALSMITMVLIAGAIVAALWLFFYYAVIKRE